MKNEQDMSKQLKLCSYFVHDEENQTPKTL